MKLLKLLAAASALSLSAAAVPASAQIVPISFIGTVSSGYDQTGLFGTAGANLAGDAFVATYVFNTTLGQTYNYSYNGGYYSYSDSEVYGGTGNGGVSPLISASITIAGKTLAVAGAYSADIDAYFENYYGNTYSGQGVNAEDYAYNGVTYTYSGLSNYLYGTNNNALSGDISKLYSGDTTALNSSGSYSAYGYNYNTGNTFVNTYANLVATRVTVGAVPEPTTWLMMIVGLGAVGVALRRRKSAVAGQRAVA